MAEEITMIRSRYNAVEYESRRKQVAAVRTAGHILRASISAQAVVDGHQHGMCQESMDTLALERDRHLGMALHARKQEMTNDSSN